MVPSAVVLVLARALPVPVCAIVLEILSVRELGRGFTLRAPPSDFLSAFFSRVFNGLQNWLRQLG